MLDDYEWMNSGPDFEADRAAAIQWARQILTQDFVVLDTETTGLDYDDEAVSIGLVAKDGTVLLDTLLCHEKPSDPKALATHGITWEMTRGAPKFVDVWPELAGQTQGKQLLGYNASFDLRIIAQMLDRYWPKPIYDPPGMMLTALHDVMGYFAQFYGDWNDYHQSYTWKKLTYAAAFLNVPTSGAHGAAADALMTLRVVERMAAEKVRGE